jgi:hypothetical protein
MNTLRLTAFFSTAAMAAALYIGFLTIAAVVELTIIVYKSIF